MFMKTGWLKKGIVLVLALSLLMGCAGNTEDESNNEGSNGGSTEQGTDNSGGDSSESTDEPVTIKITWWGGQGRHEYTQQLLDLYTESHPNVTFEAVPSGWDGYFDKLSTQAAAGSLPDIVQMDYLYISTYANNNSVADLQEFIDDGTIDVSNIEPVLLESGRIGDRMAGLVASTSIISVGYNTEVFDEAGVDYPTPDWTWTDFMDRAKAIHENTGKYGYAAIMADDMNFYNFYVREHGVPLFSADNKSLGYDDDQIYVDFVNQMTELIDAGAMPNPDAYESIKALGTEGSPVVTGEGAMLQEWSNYTVKVSEINKNIDLMNPPYLEGGDKGLWMKPGMFFSVAENSTVKKEAAAFIDWFINSEEANAIIMAERGVPVSSAISDYLVNSGNLTEEQEEMFQYVSDAAEHSKEAPAPDPVGISEINEAFKNSVYRVLYNQSTAEEMAASFREEANSILSRLN